MSNFEVWQQTFSDLRSKQSLHTGAVNRARADHEAAVQSGDIDAIVRSNEVMRDTTARLTVITDLVERHKTTREIALAADRREVLVELVREHQPLKAEGMAALERVLAALEVFDSEVSRFAEVVTRVQNSARLCNQLPAIRITVEHQKSFNRLYETKAAFFDAVMRASSTTA